MDEKRWRKRWAWAFVAFVEWSLLVLSLVSLPYGESARAKAILFFSGLMAVLAFYLAIGSPLVDRIPSPSSRVARTMWYAAFPFYPWYLFSILMIGFLMLELGAANADPFPVGIVFQVGMAGIVLTLCAQTWAFFHWHRAVRTLAVGQPSSLAS